MPDITEALKQRHPDYEAMLPRWSRYRAFTSGLETNKQKKAWLPQGSQESDANYKVRVALTHSLGQSHDMVDRMVGKMSKNPADRDYGEGVVPDGLTAFDDNADRQRTNIHNWFRTLLDEALTMGFAYGVVDRDSVDGAITAGEEGLPFVELWRAEDVINWDRDSAGRFLWAILCKTISVQTGPLESRRSDVIYRVLDRTSGAEYRGIVNEIGETKEVRLAKSWTHGLGMVPVVKLNPFGDESYIRRVSLADLRIMQLESDQSHASYLHGSPLMKIKTTRDLDKVGIGTSNAIKLNPDDNEDADYMTIDTAGMDIRESIIERTRRRGLNAAGVDAETASGETTQPKSGVAMAYSFSQSEEPILQSITTALDVADNRIHELVARYLTAGTQPVEAQVFTGTIRRPRRWDLLDTTQLIDTGDMAWPRVKSPTWRRIYAGQVASRILPNLTDEERSTILAELGEADFNAVDAPFLPGIDVTAQGV